MIVEKCDLSKFEEDPEPDDLKDNELFNICLDFPSERTRENFKKYKVDDVTTFKHTSYQENSPACGDQTNVSKAEE